MKQMQTFMNRLASVTMACLTLALVACDKDDDTKTDPDLTLQQMVGNYSGSFDFKASPSDLNPNPQPQTDIPVSFEVTDQATIHFPEFPIEAILKALVGESAAETLLEQIGTISYDANMIDVSANASRLSASLTTPVLRINIGLEVVITIESPQELSFTKEGLLEFTLKTTQYQMGSFEPASLVNELIFTARKQ